MHRINIVDGNISSTDGSIPLPPCALSFKDG